MRVNKPTLNQIETSYKAYKTQIEKQLPDLKNGRNQNVKENKDSIEISSKAKELFKSKALQSSEQAFISKDRLAEVLKQTAIARDDVQAEKISDTIMLQVSEKEARQAEKLQAVRKRLDEGFYNSPQVIEKIAEGLMKEMKF